MIIFDKYYFIENNAHHNYFDCVLVDKSYTNIYFSLLLLCVEVEYNDYAKTQDSLKKYRMIQQF